MSFRLLLQLHGLPLQLLLQFGNFHVMTDCLPTLLFQLYIAKNDTTNIAEIFCINQFMDNLGKYSAALVVECSLPYIARIAMGATLLH